MGHLKEYNGLEEKQKNFKSEVIDTREKFEEFWADNSENNSIWRGVPESKWMLYTSLQRFWIENDFQDSFEEVKNYLNHVISYAKTWNHGFIENYLKNYGFSYATIYTYLSILRHYGAPTPILDWSRNFEVALFFGSYYSSPIRNNDNINDYFSVYSLTSNHPIMRNDFKQNILYYFWNMSPNFQETVQKQEQNNIDQGLTEVEIYQNKINLLNNFAQDNLDDETIFYKDFENFPLKIFSDRNEDRIKLYINNNYKITNQDGVFFQNSYPTLPLEEAISDHTLNIRERAIKNGGEPPIHKVALRRNRDNFYCWEIHKSLRLHILGKLENQGITEGYLFPDLGQLAEDSKNSYLNQ